MISAPTPTVKGEGFKLMNASFSVPLNRTIPLIHVLGNSHLKFTFKSLRHTKGVYPCVCMRVCGSGGGGTVNNLHTRLYR